VIYLDLTLRSGARLVVPLEGGEARQLAARLRAFT
jgi:hypothetical protein